MRTNPSPIRLYLKRLSYQRQARVWLAHGDPDAIAARCLFHLNRYARDHDHDAPAIYRLKNHAVRLFHQAGHCRRATLYTQTLTCWACNGTGIYHDWDDYGETCYRCDGTGIYRQHLLWCFHFVIAGQSYIWHQPQRLVTWPVKPDSQPITEHQAPNRYVASLLDRDTRDLYAITLHEYLCQRGIPTADLPQFGPVSLTHALHAT